MHLPSGDLDVLTIGETLIDFISQEVTDRLHEARTFCKYLGGSPANIALYVTRLGGRAAVISKMGVGAFGQFLRDELQCFGVVTDYLVLDPRVHTSLVFITHFTGTPDFEVVRQGDAKLTADEINPEAIRRARVVHASTFALSREPCRSAIRWALRQARDGGKITSLDPNYSPRVWPDRDEALEVLRELFPYVTLTKPSLDDATRLFGPGSKPAEYIRMFHDLGPEVVVFTMGGQGVLLSHGGSVTHIPARPVKVVDATAAGDSFWAGFLTALLDGHELKKCALFAREIVEMKLTTVGPLPTSIDRAEIYARVEGG